MLRMYIWSMSNNNLQPQCQVSDESWFLILWKFSYQLPLYLNPMNNRFDQDKSFIHEQSKIYQINIFSCFDRSILQKKVIYSWNTDRQMMLEQICSDKQKFMMTITEKEPKLILTILCHNYHSRNNWQTAFIMNWISLPVYFIFISLCE